MSVFSRCARGLAGLLFLAGAVMARDPHFAVLISANAEWRALRPLFPNAVVRTSPYGEYFYAGVARERVLFFQGGWGKVAAPGRRSTLSIISIRRG